jgi:hypothetical protein
VVTGTQNLDGDPHIFRDGLERTTERPGERCRFDRAVATFEVALFDFGPRLPYKKLLPITGRQSSCLSLSARAQVLLKGAVRLAERGARFGILAIF